MAGQNVLRGFIAFTLQTIERHSDDEVSLLHALTPALADLVRHDDWLAPAYSQPDPLGYRTCLLYGDPLDRLSVVSMVWGVGQRTPIHDHHTWGLVGALRGAEMSTAYALDAAGVPVAGATSRLGPGEVVAISPSIGDIHSVANACEDAPSVSIHVYGGNISLIERSTYDPVTGATSPVFSRYANNAVPNLWVG